MKNIYEKQFNECLLNVLEILEKDDDRTFAEKKAEVIEYLTDRGEQSSDIVEEGLGVKIFTQFWERGEISSSMNGIVLRRVKDIDKEKFLELYRENTIMPSMFRDDLSKDFLWQEHIKNTTFYFRKGRA